MSGVEGCPSEVRAALGFYEALRRLDFTPDEIFLIVARHGTCQERESCLHLFVTVRRNVQEYNLDCGRTDVDATGLVRWSVAWNTGMTTRTRGAIYDEWLERGLAADLVADLELRGMLRKAN